MINNYLHSFMLLFILLNPFLLIIYILDIVQELPFRLFTRVLMRASIISGTLFVLFALVGDAIFRNVLQAQFASFQIFGGIVFLIIGIRFIFTGSEAIRGLRGNPQHIAGAIAMPIMVGPGTVGASIVIGQQLPRWYAVLAVLTAVSASVIVVLVLKYIHDYVKPRNEKLIERYIEVVGRVTALIIGTLSVEMIMRGTRTWLRM